MPIRDWVWTRQTMRSLKVKSANENAATIGFVDTNGDRIAHVNNLWEKQFGISPKDRQALNAAVLAVLKRVRLVQLIRAAWRGKWRRQPNPPAAENTVYLKNFLYAGESELGASSRPTASRSVLLIRL